MNESQKNIVEDIILSLQNHKRSIPMGARLDPEYKLYNMREDALKIMLSEVDDRNKLKAEINTLLKLNLSSGKEKDRLRLKIEAQRERIVYLEGATHHATGTPLTKANYEIDRLKRELSKQTYSAQFRRGEIVQRELSAWKETNAESVKEIIKLNLKLGKGKKESIEREAFISQLCVERFKLEREALKANAEIEKLKSLVYQHEGGEDDGYEGKTSPVTWKEAYEEEERYESRCKKNMKDACEKIKAHPDWKYGENAYPSPHERAIVAGCQQAVRDLQATLARIEALDIEGLLKKWGVTDKLGFRYKLAVAIKEMIGLKDE